MPKMKTHSGAKKRFKKRKSGLIKITKPFRRHLLTGKSSKRRRNFRKAAHISAVDMKHIVHLLPYN
jgi:large subunit ribosomal protein L35